MSNRARTGFTGNDRKVLVWRHVKCVAGAKRTEKAIETAARRQGKRECQETAP